jgi:zinc protease
MKHLIRFLALILLGLPLAVQAQPLPVEEIVSPGGIKAWLVQDDKLPIIAVNFAFRGGVEQDLPDQQGLATMAMNLLTEGAGPNDAAAFQQRLANQSISLGFSAGRDQLSGSLKTLSDTKQEAFRLLKLALTQPRFDADAFARVRQQQLTQIKFQLGNPSWQARYALLSQIFAGHPYAQRSLGTAATLERLTRDDAAAFVRNHLAKDNLVVAVAGNISGPELARLLDDVFGALPAAAQLRSISDVTWPKNPTTLAIDYKGTQSELLFALPSLKRQDADWYAAEIVNYTLGGGGFASLLMQEVRDKRGLTYGISTALSPMDHAAMLLGSASTDNAKAGAAWDLIRRTWDDFLHQGITQEKLDAAKAYLTGAAPLQLTSTSAIANYLVGLQLDGMPKDYLEQRNEKLRQVTLDDARRVQRQWFDPSQATLAVIGTPEGIATERQLQQVRQ